MHGLVESLWIVVGVFIVAFIGPAVAAMFLVWRKRRVQSRRRPPIEVGLLRPPGHTLREELDDAQIELLSDLFMMVVMPLVMLSILLAYGHARGLNYLETLAPVIAMAAVGFIAFMLRKLWLTAQRLDRLRTGYDAELAVGQELHRLMRQGAAVFHDVPGEQFNIDHVVVAAEGVFAVETKGFNKSRRRKGRAGVTVEFDGTCLRFPDWTTIEPIDQARRQSSWLSKWLTKATGSPVDVAPVVALPGWWVERTGRGDVQVLNAKELGYRLLRFGVAPALPPAHIQRIEHQLDQRCRTIAPRDAVK